MHLSFSDSVAILALLATIICAIAAIVMLDRKRIRYTLLVPILVILLIAIGLIVNKIISIDRAKSAANTGKDNKIKVIDNAIEDTSVKQINHIGNVMHDNMFVQSKERIKSDATRVASIGIKSTDRLNIKYEYKRIISKDNFIIELNGCRRNKNTIWCNVVINNTGKERTMFLPTYIDANPDDWACFIVDANGNKHGPAEFDTTTMGAEVIEGPSVHYVFKPNYGVEVTLKYANVPNNINELKQFFMIFEIASEHGGAPYKKVDVDMKNIMVY